MAGDIKLTPSDSPDDRIIPNSMWSPFAGVGSILVTTKKTSYLGTGAALYSRHVLTAAAHF